MPFAANGNEREDSTMVNIAGLGHFGVHVEDVDATVAWYEEKLGFERVIEFPTAELPVPLLEQGGARIVILRRGDVILEVTGAREMQPHPMRWKSHVEAVRFGGFGHLCFLVDDCATAAQELEAQGVPMDMAVREWPELGITTAHFHDNEGNDLEILSYHSPEGFAAVQ
jgi:lactoylglutathione lyase